jgi:hypothetical protein
LEHIALLRDEIYFSGYGFEWHGNSIIVFLSKNYHDREDDAV